MRRVLILLGIIQSSLPLSVAIAGCPDLSGYYAETAPSGAYVELTATQYGCQSLSIQRVVYAADGSATQATRQFIADGSCRTLENDPSGRFCSSYVFSETSLNGQTHDRRGGFLSAQITMWRDGDGYLVTEHRTFNPYGQQINQRVSRATPRQVTPEPAPAPVPAPPPLY